MPRLVHRQITTIHIVSVELTWADDGSSPEAEETATVVHRRSRSSHALKDVKEKGPSSAEVVDVESEP